MSPARDDGPAVVALGGGHGLAATLSALRRVTHHLTGIVTVADNGGSSGRLRTEFGILPPGDLRMALAALCGDDDWGRAWAEILQHRFGGDGPLAGHPVGNLLLAALWEMEGDQVSGLDLVAELLGARGRVLPMANVPLDIEADVEFGSPEHVELVRGQVEVATTSGRILGVRLDPANPPACPQAVAALDSAEWVTIGPGSWFTSVMPTLLVPQLRQALLRTPAKRALVLNLVGQPGETEHLSPAEHLEVLAAHAPDLHLDVVVADAHTTVDVPSLQHAARALGAELVMADVRSSTRPDQHDPQALAEVFATTFAPGSPTQA
ncbi:uridine diphosphate-N-acetylglucosamine-binding protein YvcK [Aeromicrobium sp. 636]|uniref:Putative gluconeogenesis factor n=1 Tax=Aeromicrobium senzhongii TaxID=2663859 RepID=A0A8I0JYI7_9ACTN|nr:MULTISPECIES: uridine diphosphate-N-acetylglucosamine-binding protein YvcK [Aeromicrobium]MBC9224917.1 uridine diphosphate-N-acetylglucosamine-binding protein YvcK [Aeromicrobium senzhongii]MCQ3997029.1 uridine diphosphate-N-acetylglucosamine-binding protein YvcK [Aeromicrobium sp. 636]